MNICLTVWQTIIISKGKKKRCGIGKSVEHAAEQLRMAAMYNQAGEIEEGNE